VTTRLCHSWSYFDPSTAETVLVALHAHHSLHVNVGGDAAPHNTGNRNSSNNNSCHAAQTSSSPALAERGGNEATTDVDQEGLCGYTWELTWLPNPSLSSPRAAPTHAQFSFLRSTPLSNSTVRGGGGGVLFLSSRHVLISTETMTAAPACSTPPRIMLDSFTLEEQPRNPASPAESHRWERAADAMELPCPLPASTSSSSADACRTTTPLLVHGVSLPFTSPSTRNGGSVARMRVLYVAAVQHESAAATQPLPVAENLFVGVADLCILSGTSPSANSSSKLHCVLRHTMTQTQPLLRVPLPQPASSSARLRDAAALSGSTALSLTPRDLLWVYVADVERNQREGPSGTQLYGSLVAVLPCFHNGVSSVLGASSSSSSYRHQRHHLPVVCCSGFHAASPYGVLGVASSDMDALAGEQLRRCQRCCGHPEGDADVLTMEEAMAQLLPSARRTVYEVEIGQPVDQVLAADAAALTSPTSSASLPLHSSVLLCVFDGVLPQGTVRGTQGLHTTQTPSWMEITAAGTPVHRVPLARTLWCGLTPVVPSSAKAIHGSNLYHENHSASWYSTGSSTGAHVDVVRWALTDFERWAAYLSTPTSTAHATAGEARVAAAAGCDVLAEEDVMRDDDEGEVEVELGTASSALSAVARSPASAIATVTAVASHVAPSPSDTLSYSCLPTTNTIAREVVVWYYVIDGAEKATADAGCLRSSVTFPAACMAACLPLPCWVDPAERESWTAQVAEWVVSRYFLSPSSVSADAVAAAAAAPTLVMDEKDVDVLALTSTCRVMRVLWAYAVLGTAGKDGDDDNAVAKPAWPQTLMDVLRGTVADAAQHQTRLHVYARAVVSLVSAGLASGGNCTAARREAEVAHLNRAAAVFLRLVLQVVMELDWHAGDAQGRRCAQWMTRCFLGEAIAATAAAETKEDVQRAVLVEGRAMQVLLHLGAAKNTDALAWLGRMLLLYTCRNHQRPLDLTVADIVDAAGVAWDASQETLQQQPRANRDVAEWRESMEYALLRMVQPDTLHQTIHSLAYSTGSRSAHAPAASPAQDGACLLRHGLLSVADLHALVCVGWSAAQVQEIASLGFSFVCLLVDVAMRATTTATLADSADAIEKTALAVVGMWEWGACEGAPVGPEPHARAPVYPLLSLCNAVSTSRDPAPFPFSLLPPLLTVELWYHVVDRLCRALQLVPEIADAPRKSDAGNEGGPSAAAAGVQQPGTTATHYDGGDNGEEQELLVWARRGRSDAAALRELHRGLCVLRCLTQGNPLCAVELFAAMQLVYTPSSGDSRDGEPAVTGGTVEGDGVPSWGNQSLVVWQHLLSLEAPPLSDPTSALAYREQCLSRSPHFADLMRVLHLVYASAGSGNVLRAQLWRATTGSRVETTSGTVAKQPRSSTNDTHCSEQMHWDRALQAWLAAATPTLAPAQQAGALHAASSDAVAPWLLQVWAHVMLCDPAAVTDVGMYEQAYAALAYVKQKSTSSAADASEELQQRLQQTAADDAAFAVLRPCFMYAYPLLWQLAIAEEVGGSLGGRHAASAVTHQRFLQFNEPLIWQGGTATPSPHSSRQRSRELEQLCAGEVCERARRQLRRLVGLYDAPTAMVTRGSTDGAGDRRFRVLASLLSLQPAAVDVAQRQRRLLRLRIESPSPQARASQCASLLIRASEGKYGVSSMSSPPASHTTASRSGSSEHVDSDAEETPALTPFYVSPLAAYVMAASASAMGDRSDGTFPPQQLSWFTVVCEVMRRELRTYVMTEFLLARCITAVADEDDASSSGDRAARTWRLVATEKKLKDFINALAEAVEPLTQALVNALRCSLYQSVVLVLVFDTLHQLFFAETKAAALQPAAATISADAPLLHLLQHWLRHVITPLYSSLSVADQTTIAHVVTRDFAVVYLADVHGKHAGGDNVNGAAKEQQGVGPQTHTGNGSASYVESTLHHTWQQWRKQGGGGRGSPPAPADTLTEAAVLACVEHCVVPEQRGVLHVPAPFSGAPGGSSTPDVAKRPPAAHDAGLRKNMTASSARGGGTFWMEAGSALRSSFIQTIGATVAPRATQDRRSVLSVSATTAGPSTPQPTPVFTAEKEEERAVAPSQPSRSPEVAAATTSEAAPAPALVVRTGSGDGSGGGTTPTAARDVDEAIQLLVKEEAFLRRQLTHELLASQQPDFFASPAFQHALVHLYLVMRIEKRRKELITFALDQHDLIFSFVSREQQRLHEQCRRELRQAWIDYGERQRFAIRRMLQEERDARMGVQAMAYAERSFWRDAEQAQRVTWLVQEEGRRGIELQEQDGRDVLSVAAAQAQLELARRAVEAEEEAYWKAEEEAWARMEEEEKIKDKNAATQPIAPAPLKETKMDSATSVPPQRGARAAASSTFASPLVALPPSSPPPKLPQSPAASAEVVGTAEKKGEVAADRYLQTGLTHAVAQAAAEVGSSSLFGTLSRWQTALRETVAPAPPARKADVKEKLKSSDDNNPAPLGGSAATSAVVVSRDASIPPLPAALPRPAAKTASVEDTTAAVVDDDNDDWGWGSEVSGGDEDDRVPVKPVVFVKTTTAADVGKSHVPSPTVPHVVPLQGRRLAPLSSPAHTTAGPVTLINPPTDKELPRTTAALSMAGKPGRRKKGLAAALLVEPISSTAKESPAHAPPLPPLPSLHALPATQPAEVTPRLSCPDDATPNPVRSILSAVEAAATETISKKPTVPAEGASPAGMENACDDAEVHTPLPPTQKQKGPGNDVSGWEDHTRREQEEANADEDDGWGEDDLSIPQPLTHPLLVMAETTAAGDVDVQPVRRDIAVATFERTRAGATAPSHAPHKEPLQTADKIELSHQRAPLVTAASATTSAVAAPAETTEEADDDGWSWGDNEGDEVMPVQPQQHKTVAASQPSLVDRINDVTRPATSAAVPGDENAAPHHTTLPFEPATALQPTVHRSEAALSTTRAGTAVVAASATVAKAGQRDAAETDSDNGWGWSTEEGDVVMPAQTQEMFPDDTRGDGGRAVNSVAQAVVAAPTEDEEGAVRATPVERLVDHHEQAAIATVPLSHVVDVGAARREKTDEAGKRSGDDNDDGWGWCDDDGEDNDAVAPTQGVGKKKAKMSSTTITTTSNSSTAPAPREATGGDEAAVVLAASAVTKASADAPTRATSATTTAANGIVDATPSPPSAAQDPAAMKSSVLGGAKEYDTDVSRSDSVPPHTSTPAVPPPHRRSPGTKAFTDLQLQQMYLKELELREQLVNYL
jgi:hypothetical protein